MFTKLRRIAYGYSQAVTLSLVWVAKIVDNCAVFAEFCEILSKESLSSARAVDIFAVLALYKVRSPLS